MVNSIVVGVRVSPKDLENMKKCVAEGHAKNLSDLGCQAIREMVSSCKVIT